MAENGYLLFVWKPTGYELVERSECFLHRDRFVVTVRIEEIDVVGAETAQRPFDGRTNCCPGKAAMASPGADLRGDHDLVTRSVPSQPASDHRLGQ